MGLLERLKFPEDIKSLSIEELSGLAREIRQTIIETISECGGHLAPSLGTVELSIALHYIYNSPEDKMIWDVGHQAYPHKILTGRHKNFNTIRKIGGLSGFLKRSESIHDAFGAGHASTSIAAALGMAYARDKQNKKNKVIAIIGDGSLTGGMAYEALNSAGHLKTDITVVLNDNEMSISGNVGALSQMLNRIITGNFYNTAKEELKRFIQRYKSADKMIQISRKLEESIKGLILPGIFFEELGFRYIGPIDGHDLAAMIDTFQKIKPFKGPVLLHVVTKKGKGYSFAEKDPESFHGITKFSIQTGAKAQAPKVKSFTEVFGDTLCEEAEKDEKIVAITAAMTSGTGLTGFAKKFPQRFLDVGIAEESAVTIAAGMACEGLKPVVAIYSTFLQRSIDQIIHDVALQNIPVIFAIDRAGLVGDDGPTHHGVFDLSYLRMIPNMTIIAPKDENELRAAIKFSLEYKSGPIAFRYPRGSVIGVPEVDEKIEYAKAEMIRQGEDIIIFAIGPLVYDALKAADILNNDYGINISVANLRFAKPLDTEFILNNIKKHKYIFSIETNTVIGGIGSGINELISLNLFSSGKICQSLALPDRFIEHGTPNQLYDLCKLTSKHFVEHITSVLKIPQKVTEKSRSAIKITS